MSEKTIMITQRELSKAIGEIESLIGQKGINEIYDYLEISESSGIFNPSLRFLTHHYHDESPIVERFELENIEDDMDVIQLVHEYFGGIIFDQICENLSSESKVLIDKYFDPDETDSEFKIIP
ncbi:hypothetical protein [Lactococcus lactis]|jgi:hypothetical protein|uniref:hypothetical protein n=1 Tax=Lactococcus lactis TaxID=1358 RepID=UPI002416CBD8|nr:hypothetical protein [Lactococcus lactis]MDG4959946.1 hypothetical protein [Lactococcus lactis]